MRKEELIAEVKTLKEANSLLEFRVKELERLLFGSKHERHVAEVNPQQLPLFVEEEIIPPVEENQTTENNSPRKKKKHQGRNKFPEHFPVNEIVVEPEEDTDGMVLIGYDEVKTLDYIPGSLIVNLYKFPKYTTPEGDGVIRGIMPSRPIDKGIPEAGLLAHIISQKFVYHMPFYRTMAQFKQLHGLTIPKSTINDWFVSVCTLMNPLYECLKRKLLDSAYIQADESPIKVLDTNKPGKTHQGYQWVYHSPEQNLILYNYQKGRGKNGPKELLAGYTGYLQTDGYVVYDNICKNTPIILLGCMAHARRYFIKARDNAPVLAGVAIEYIRQLYAIERAIKEENLTPVEIKQRRIEKSQPILDDLLAWAIQEKGKVTPKSLIGKAFTYLTLQWHKLIGYMDHGCLMIDNNQIENAIRPLALGRKNYLFAGSHAGAERIAMMYSFFATCKRKDVNHFIWLREVLIKLPSHPINRIEELLPGEWVSELEKSANFQ